MSGSEWNDKYMFAVRLKWSQFMNKVLMTTSLDKVKVLQPDGPSALREGFPRGHKIYDSLGENVANLKEMIPERFGTPGISFLSV